MKAPEYKMSEDEKKAVCRAVMEDDSFAVLAFGLYQSFTILKAKGNTGQVEEKNEEKDENIKYPAFIGDISLKKLKWSLGNFTVEASVETAYVNGDIYECLPVITASGHHRKLFSDGTLSIRELAKEKEMLSGLIACVGNNWIISEYMPAVQGKKEK